MKIFKTTQASTDFQLMFLIISLDSGLRTTNPLEIAYSLELLNFSIDFTNVNNFFQKIAKFSLKFSKHYKV